MQRLSTVCTRRFVDLMMRYNTFMYHTTFHIMYPTTCHIIYHTTPWPAYAVSIYCNAAYSTPSPAIKCIQRSSLSPKLRLILTPFDSLQVILLGMECSKMLFLEAKGSGQYGIDGMYSTGRLEISGTLNEQHKIMQESHQRARAIIEFCNTVPPSLKYGDTQSKIIHILQSDFF